MAQHKRNVRSGATRNRSTKRLQQLLAARAFSLIFAVQFDYTGANGSNHIRRGEAAQLDESIDLGTDGRRSLDPITTEARRGQERGSNLVSNSTPLAARARLLASLHLAASASPESAHP